jgi:hypothetical protein
MLRSMYVSGYCKKWTRRSMYVSGYCKKWTRRQVQVIGNCATQIAIKYNTKMNVKSESALNYS